MNISVQEGNRKKNAVSHEICHHARINRGRICLHRTAAPLSGQKGAGQAVSHSTGEELDAIREGIGEGGYPVCYPFIDLVEIGAGGGTIIWVDEGGALLVGPLSAGTDPGHTCYEKGGEDPTVTDANLVLGILESSWANRW